MNLIKKIFCKEEPVVNKNIEDEIQAERYKQAIKTDKAKIGIIKAGEELKSIFKDEDIEIFISKVKKVITNEPD